MKKLIFLLLFISVSNLVSAQFYDEYLPPKSEDKQVAPPEPINLSIGDCLIKASKCYSASTTCAISGSALVVVTAALNEDDIQPLGYGIGAILYIASIVKRYEGDKYMKNAGIMQNERISIISDNKSLGLCFNF